MRGVKGWGDGWGFTWEGGEWPVQGLWGERGRGKTFWAAGVGRVEEALAPATGFSAERETRSPGCTRGCQDTRGEWLLGLAGLTRNVHSL